METSRESEEPKEHLRAGRNLQMEKWEFGSDDTGGRTSHGYLQEKAKKHNVVNLHILTDRVAEKLEKEAEHDDVLRNSLQCDQ